MARCRHDPVDSESGKGTKTAPSLNTVYQYKYVQNRRNIVGVLNELERHITLPSLDFSVTFLGTDDDNVTRCGNCLIDSESLR